MRVTVREEVAGRGETVAHWDSFRGNSLRDKFPGGNCPGETVWGQLPSGATVWGVKVRGIIALGGIAIEPFS